MVRFRSAVLFILLAPGLWAQAPSSKPRVQAKSSVLDSGAINAGVYRNSAFGFSYKLPFGWVDRTAEMQDDSAAASKSRVLLATFERPPEATGDTVNSAVVIAAEPLLAGIKTAGDYFESLSGLATAKGFQVEEEPHQVSVGTMRLVRGDFSKARGTLAVRQTSLAMLQKGYAVSFTFIGGSTDEINELIEKLSFVARQPQP